MQHASICFITFFSHTKRKKSYKETKGGVHLLRYKEKRNATPHLRPMATMMHHEFVGKCHSRAVGKFAVRGGPLLGAGASSALCNTRDGRQ